MRKRLARWASVTAIALTLPWIASSTGTGNFEIRWNRDPRNTDKIFVELSGLQPGLLAEWSKSHPGLADWQTVFPVYVTGQRPSEARAMFGTYTIQKNVVRFEPGFSLEKGAGYEAAFHPEHWPGGTLRSDRVVTARFKIDRARKSSTVVDQIYPTSSIVPENLLKFYIQFSAPMSRGGIYSYIHLRTESGKEVELPFLEIGEELWDPTMTRLTLFIDPGRIKRGVRPLVEIGPVLEVGKRYSLRIDADWKDGNGNPLKKSYEKHFRAGPPDRDRVSTERWKILPPKANGIGPLTILFPKPMDHALALRMIQVSNEAGAPFPGHAMLADHERRWEFSPDKPWNRQPYEVKVASTMEDLAGNSVAKSFDVDVFEPQARIADPTVSIPFQAR